MAQTISLVELRTRLDAGEDLVLLEALPRASHEEAHLAAGLPLEHGPPAAA